MDFQERPGVDLAVTHAVGAAWLLDGLKQDFLEEQWAHVGVNPTATPFAGGTRQTIDLRN